MGAGTSVGFNISVSESHRKSFFSLGRMGTDPMALSLLCSSNLASEERDDECDTEAEAFGVILKYSLIFCTRKAARNFLSGNTSSFTGSAGVILF